MLARSLLLTSACLSTWGLLVLLVIADLPAMLAI